MNVQAALPMYLAPPEAVQALWTALAALLRADAASAHLALPAQPSWPEDLHTHWQEPTVLLSQTCGYPLTTLLQGQVQLVGTFAYHAPGVQGIHCRSQLVCRNTDVRTTLAAFANSTLAYNDTLSQSGYNALRALVVSSTRQRPFFASSVCTGGHYRSIAAVLKGQADMAAVDPVSLAHWQRSNPHSAAAVRVFDQTVAYPGLPLITALHTAAPVLAALRRALHTLAHDAAYAALRQPLLISGFVETTLADYQVCIAMQQQAGGLVL
ncbi:MAG: PhnD/SsuA/transferrin family substrate-binding protein [Rhodoferax sp.]|nr:PhnD/SsuA/transferrin family substrate-binding protein [Rhodoferax sp.]